MDKNQAKTEAAQLRSRAQAIYDDERRTLGESARALEMVCQATELENRANLPPQTTRSNIQPQTDYGARTRGIEAEKRTPTQLSFRKREEKESIKGSDQLSLF
jgi:hypothetical protein